MKRAAAPPLTAEEIAILLRGFTLTAFPAASTRAAKAEATKLVSYEAGLRRCAALWAAHADFFAPRRYGSV